MRPLPALLVALLFVTAAAFPVAGAYATPERTFTTTVPAQSIDTVQNTTNQLTIPGGEVQRTSYNETGVDVGTATEAWSTQLQHRHDALSFEERFQRADGREARARLVTDRLAAIEAQEQALDQRQDAAIARYARDEISAAAFLRTRLVVNAEASELLETLEQVSAAPDNAPEYSLNDSIIARLRSTEGELRTLTGPIGDQLQSGDSADRTLYIEVADASYMLATVTDDEYLRETRLDDARDASAPDEFLGTAVNDGDPETDRLDVADERAAELYPWLYERQRPSFTFYGDSGIYELTADHPNGDLRAYLDGGTTDVFYEEQVRDLSDVQTTAIARNVNGTLAVTVRQSSATGPLLVTASNNETGATVDGTVTIDGQPVGTTGTDGELWTVEPRGVYTVTVTADTGTTSVVVRAN
ncbi:DUF7094 domain-containing protein [Haloarcula salinisoli]|uniref:Uncharacterized protein n=1 Tax=Haloarcula salinisoli TaxID=2487746 RepID=A0A8J8C8P2_9EURY|nr:hypothetical protein [Halomicroarcula salinisoli]MBX0287687.1 hypothetical protein [Halomicroarcula salinisoli]MBX0304616.1 hypothetical protein [Halomicroarcula salinisoli]